MDKACRFCEIIAGAEPAAVIGPGVVSFAAVPESVPGHVLVVPVSHVTDALSDPEVTGQVFEAAARIAARAGQPCNLVTNAGAEAGQKVFHFHVHVLPRRGGGPLALPSPLGITAGSMMPAVHWVDDMSLMY